MNININFIYYLLNDYNTKLNNFFVTNKSFSEFFKNKIIGAGKRLTYYIEKQGFTKKKFCEKFSFTYNSFVQILAESRPIGGNVLDQIHYALPKLNVHWLLYGEGPEEVAESEVHLLNEPAEMYVTNNDAFEYMLLKYMDNPKIKNKIYEIIQQKTN